MKRVIVVLAALLCFAVAAVEINIAPLMTQAIMTHAPQVYVWAEKNLSDEQMISFRAMLMPPASNNKVRAELCAMRARLKALNVDTPEIADVANMLDKQINALNK